MKLLIITSGGFPVPAVKGGAVQTLLEHIIAENNNINKIQLEIISPFDKEALEASKKYNNIKFHWVHIPKIIKVIDYLAYYLIKTVFKKKKALSYRSSFTLLWFIFKSSLILKNNKFDKVMFENTVLLFWSLKLWNNSLKYKGKYYYHLHNIPGVNGGCGELIRNCNKILCISDFVGRSICSEDNPIGPVDKNRIEIFFNCIDTKKFKPINDNTCLDAYRTKWGISTDEKVIVFSGRLNEEKGIKEVLEAIRYVKTKNYKLLIVGSCFYSMNIKSDFELQLYNLSKEAEDKIVFTGFVNHHEMPYIYNIADVAVLPSMWEEPAGLTIIEAMACGIPVITTKSGGIVEYTDSSCSILLERDENLVVNIAKNIDLILQNPDIADTFVGNGLTRVKKIFSTKCYINRFYEIIAR